MVGNTILCIGDAHVTNGVDLEHFRCLGNYIMAIRPSHIIIMGDFLTLNSMSAWDMDKRKTMEGRRYWDEIKAGNEALNLMLTPMSDYNARKRKIKAKLYLPEILYLEGNHEDRLKRYLEHHAELADGALDVALNLDLVKRGINYIPYREYHYINGIAFTHIPHGKTVPISGKDITAKCQSVVVDSCVFAHTHELHISNVHKQGQDHLQQVINVGCFFQEEEEYVQGRMTNYWKGLVTLHNYDHGRFDITTISMRRLLDEYK